MVFGCPPKINYEIEVVVFAAVVEITMVLVAIGVVKVFAVVAKIAMVVVAIGGVVIFVVVVVEILVMVV